MRLSEVIGRKIPLYVAFFLFTVGSVIFATAQSLPVVIHARALQGSGWRSINVLNEILVADITTLREWAVFIGLVSITFALRSVVGPVVGAFLSRGRVVTAEPILTAPLSASIGQYPRALVSTPLTCCDQVSPPDVFRAPAPTHASACLLSGHTRSREPAISS